MKQKLIVLWVIVLIMVLITFPRPKLNKTVHHDLEKLNVITIHLQGAVVFPGVYYSTEETDLFTVVEQAGGYLPNAVIPNNKIISKDEVVFIQQNQDNLPSNTLLDINKASFQELILIPNITEARAASIVIYREQNGNFSTLDELLLVKGIGVSTLEKIKPYLTIK